MTAFHSPAVQGTADVFHVCNDACADTGGLSYQAGYTDSFRLMRAEMHLLQVLGPRGLHLLLQRARSLSGRFACSTVLLGKLIGLCTDLLGEAFAQRMVHSLQGAFRLRSGAVPEDPEGLLLRANEQLLVSALNAHANALEAVARVDELARSSQRDPLTDTPNRALMLDRLQSTLALAQRRGSRAAVLFLDIDHFKQINDTLGHATGDAVLQRAAQRLQAAVRDSDAVGRHGGDEFLVVLAEVERRADAAQIARKIITDIAAPSLMADHMLHVSVSVGIAVYPNDGLDAVALIAAADAAMYRSKRRGGSSFTFYGDAQPVPGSQELQR